MNLSQFTVAHFFFIKVMNQAVPVPAAGCTVFIDNQFGCQYNIRLNLVFVTDYFDYLLYAGRYYNRRDMLPFTEVK